MESADLKTAAFKEGVRRELERRSRELILELVTRTLGKGDVLLLGILGLDARNLMLSIFIEECTKLKEELCQEHQTRS